MTVDSKLELSSSVILSDIMSWLGWLLELNYYKNGMMSCTSKTVKAMATAAAIASMMSAPTFGLLSPSIEIDESVTGEPVGSVAAGLTLGAMATLIGAGVGLAGDSADLARTTGGLVGLLSENSSEEGVGIEEVSGFEGSVD